MKINYSFAIKQVFQTWNNVFAGSRLSHPFASLCNRDAVAHLWEGRRLCIHRRYHHHHRSGLFRADIYPFPYRSDRVSSFLSTSQRELFGRRPSFGRHNI